MEKFDLWVFNLKYNQPTIISSYETNGCIVVIRIPSAAASAFLLSHSRPFLQEGNEKNICFICVHLEVSCHARHLLTALKI